MMKERLKKMPPLAQQNCDSIGSMDENELLGQLQMESVSKAPEGWFSFHGIQESLGKYPE